MKVWHYRNLHFSMRDQLMSLKNLRSSLNLWSLQ